MASKGIAFDIIARDKATATLKHVADQTDVSGSRISASLGKVSHGISQGFGKLGAVVGGEVGELFTRISEGLDNVGEHAAGMGKKLAIGGTAIAGLGVALQSIGGKDKQAADQLKRAIEDTGNSYSDYREEIEKTIKHNENFAISAVETQRALQTLTTATGDPAKALSMMGTLADAAAAKHIKLSEAADGLAKAYAGNGRWFKQFGVTMTANKTILAAVSTATKAHQTAVANLAKAQKNLADLTEIDNAKANLSESAQIALRKAHEAVTLAIKEHGAKSKEAAKAEQNLADTQARLTAGTQLSVAQQIALRNAHDAVTAAQAKVTSSEKNLTSATDAAKKSTNSFDEALSAVAVKTKGQASSAVDNFVGRLDVLKTKFEDATAKMGQKYGPAVTGLGVTFMGAGSALQIFRDHQDRAAASAAKLAQAQEEAANKAYLAASKVIAADAEVSAAEVAVAEASNASVAEQEAAQARLVAARETAASAIEASYAAEAEAGAVAAEASSAAFGPVGLAIGAIATVGIAAAGALHLFGQKTKEQVKPTEELTSAITADKLALGDNTRALVINSLEKEGAYDAARKLGVSQKTLTDAVMGDAAAMQIVAAKTADAKRNADLLAHGHSLGSKAARDNALAEIAVANAVGDVTGQLQASKQAADNEAAANGKSTSTQLDAVKADQARLRSLGATAAQAQALASAYERLPAAKKTAVTLDDFASAKIKAIKAKLDAITAGNAAVFLVGLNNKRQAMDITPHATGGSLNEGWNSAGEAGVELLHKSGSRVDVYTSGQTQKMLAPAASSVEQPIVIHVMLDGRQIQTSQVRIGRQNGKKPDEF